MKPAILFTAAAASYAANCVLGVVTWRRSIGGGRASGGGEPGRIPTRGHESRWLHHALYVSTCILAAAATSSLLWSNNRAGWALLPAAVPLAAVPSVSARSRRHPLVALSAAPFFLASTIKAWR